MRIDITLYVLRGAKVNVERKRSEYIIHNI